MEYVDIQQASTIASVSAKTIRRAIHQGKLIDHETRPNRSRIAINDLNEYIASRQSTHMDTYGHVHVESDKARITALESLQQSMQDQIASLQQSIQELEGKILLLSPVQAIVPTFENSISTNTENDGTEKVPNGTLFTEEPTITPVPTTKTKRRTKQSEPTITLAEDFSRFWQDQYKSTAIHQDVQAWVIVKPTLGEPGQYHINCDWEPTKVKRVIHDEMRQRGETLRNDLLTAVHNALIAHGWTVVNEHHSYRLPDA